MNESEVRALVEQVRTGTLHPDDALAQLRRLPFADLGFARVDHHRAFRQAMSEAVYAPGKTALQCAEIVLELLEHDGGPVILTRADRHQVEVVIDKAPGGQVTAKGSLATVVWRSEKLGNRRALIVAAGTSDLPVAEECGSVLRAFGIGSDLLADCGVAGIHRLLSSVEDLWRADAVVVIAGMEGALASVVAGISSAPVIAVPTSAGYGSSFEGITALLSMHASCAAGVTVVGIDNGFGAACAVHRVLGARSRMQD